MDLKMKTLAHNAQWLMTKLQAHPTREGAFQTTVNFSGYVSLLATISDLMKLCALAELAEEPHISPLVGAAPIDIAGILELALQLMPHGEAEFLDEVEMLLAGAEEEELPLYNYSTITILETNKKA